MNKESVQKIAQHYGYDAQSRQCIEEMAELTQAINKVWRCIENRKNTVNKIEDKRYEAMLNAKTGNLIEEIADVQIMLWQLEYLLNADVEPIIKQKINRKLERIERE